METVAVILPAHNEAPTVAGVIRAFHHYLPDALIVVVDNNSSDGTTEEAERTIRELRARGLVLFEGKQGKAFAVRRAFTDVDADVYVLCDADLTYPAEQVGALLEPVLNGRADMAVGDRHALGAYRSENKRPFHSFGNTLVRWLINILFGGHLNDILSGYRVSNRRFVKNYPILSRGFDIEAEMTLHALDKNFTIMEVPIHYRDRPEGSASKVSTLRDGLRILILIFSVFKNYRPLAFFGGLAALFFATGAMAGYPAVNDYYTRHYVLHTPLAILATGLMILAFVSFSIGLILDNVAAINHFQYALRLMDWPHSKVADTRTEHIFSTHPRASELGTPADSK